MAARGSTWSDEKVKELLSIWGEKKVQLELDGAKRKAPIHEKIAQALQEKGFNRDSEQCKTKIKSLKRVYRPIKDHHNKTGNDKKKCQYYDEMDAILGH